MRTLCWIAIATLGLPGVLAAQQNDLITKETQKAIDVGLNELAKEQADDGSWGQGHYKNSVGLTSLAGLAFLSGNHHPDRGEYGKNVSKALAFVLGQEDKNRPGFFKDGAAVHGPMYSHGFATLFLADAHDTITDAKLKADVRSALERATKLILESQNREGGWRYQPKPLDADLTVTVCQVAALRAARDVGVGVPRAALDRAAKYILSCQNLENGGFRYLPHGGPAGYARTAAAVTALDRLGAKDEAIDKGLNFLVKFGGANDPKLHYYFGQYYAAKGMWYRGEKHLQNWYPAVRDELLKNRQKTGKWAHGAPIDPHYDAAMALIVLQMPHGHLASMRR